MTNQRLGEHVAVVGAAPSPPPPPPLLLLLLLLPSALPQLAGDTGPPALLCDSFIDSAKRCNFCPAAVAAHAACIELHATEMRLLNGGTRREPCRHGVFEYSVYDIFVGRSLANYGEFSEVEWSDVLQPALLRRHRLDQNAGITREMRPTRETESERGVDAGPVGFDVGANIGVFTVPMARVARPYGGRVVAVEADGVNHALLRTNTELNRLADLGESDEPTIILLHAAASAMPRPAARELMQGSPATASLRQRLGNFGSPELSQTVERVSIDQIMAREGLTQCDVLKLDVEGHELDVLRGAAATVSRYRPVLYVENDRYSTAVLEYLATLDYRCVWHVPPLFSVSNWKNSTRVVFTEESANLLCHHHSIATGLPSWALMAQSVTAGNQLSTLAAARLEQNLQHYDLLGERYGGRWWLHSAQILRDTAATEGWGEQQRAALQRIERFFRSEQQRKNADTMRGSERDTQRDTEAGRSGDMATGGEETRDRLLCVLH